MGAVEEKVDDVRSVAAAAKEHDSAAQFVAKFRNHHQLCVALAKRFTSGNSELKDSAAISQLCRASQEMLEQAKQARALTEIYLALDETHRDAVRPLIVERFKDITKLARISWLRFCDSIQIARHTRPEIAAAQRDFEPHANEFQQALREFLELSENAS